MIVIKENERLYLNNWVYNACRITTALANVVENNNGVVKPHKKAIVSNRTLSEAIRDIESKLEKIETKQLENYTEVRANYIEAQKRKLEEYNAINNDPITITHTTWISFVFEDTYYMYSMDDNPFFDFYYIKTPIKNGQYSRDAASEKDSKQWLYDCFFSFGVSDADITEAANLIFNMLVSAKNSVIIRDKKRVRVPNYYNNGYHYETIYEKERFEKIDWM